MVGHTTFKIYFKLMLKFHHFLLDKGQKKQIGNKNRVILPNHTADIY